MRQRITTGLIVVCGTALLLLSCARSGQSLPGAQAQQGAPPEPKIKVGDIAPDFTLRDQNGKEASLKDFRGKKNVVLAFYVFAFTSG